MEVGATDRWPPHEGLPCWGKEPGQGLLVLQGLRGWGGARLSYFQDKPCIQELRTSAPPPAPLQPWYPGGHSSLCRSSQLPSPANTFRLEIPGWIPPTWNLLSPMSVSSRLPAGVRGSTPASLTRLLVAPQLNGDGVRGQGRGVPGQGEVALRARSAVVLPAGLIHQLALLGVRHFTWVHWRGAGGELREGLGPRGIQGRRSGAL